MSINYLKNEKATTVQCNLSYTMAPTCPWAETPEDSVELPHTAPLPHYWATLDGGCGGAKEKPPVRQQVAP